MSLPGAASAESGEPMPVYTPIRRLQIDLDDSFWAKSLHSSERQARGFLTIVQIFSKGSQSWFSLGRGLWSSPQSLSHAHRWHWSVWWTFFKLYSIRVISKATLRTKIVDELSCRSCLYIFEINSFSVASFAIIFSHSEGCLFTLLIVSFVVQKLLILIRSHLFIFAFISNILGGGS